MTTLQVDPDPTFARMRCTIIDAQGGALTRTQDGTTETVRGAESVTGDQLVDDYEVRFGIPATYAIEDSGEETATLDMGTTGGWLSTANDPGFAVTVEDQVGMTSATPGQAWLPLDATAPIAVYGARAQRTGDLQLILPAAQVPDFEALTATGDPLLLRAPPGCWLFDGWLWAAEITQDRIGPPGVVPPVWRFTLRYTEVASPAGSIGLDPSNSYDAVVARCTVVSPTYADVLTNHATYLDLLLTPHPHA